MVSVDHSCSVRQEKNSLRPFIHQVTGRSHMLSLNSGTVCKSLLPRELLFYKSVPSELLPFIPRLKGVLYAELDESTSDGSYTFNAKQVFLRPKSKSEIETTCKRFENKSRFESELQDSYESVLFKGLERFKYDMTTGFNSHPWTIDKDAEALVEYIGANPWAVRQHRREINRMLSVDGNWTGRVLGVAVDADGNYLDDQCLKLLRGYLMLEDVSEGFQHPNVIDFKLGRQMERDDCSQEKKTKHAELVKNSSTGTLMLRLAGMQVYQVKTCHYLCRDKYYGRGLSSSGFKGTIRQFLNNGERLLVEVIAPIVSKLREIQSILMKKDTFRFYASSLLILYEGNSCGMCEKPKSNSHPMGSCCHPRRTEVKMIDFAHSTYKGFNGDKTCYEGPDLDCITALGNLIEILNEIGNEN